MTLNEWYESGLTPDEYIESMEKHKENLLHIYDNFTVPNDTDFFQTIRAKDLRVLVLTADWCGDAMLNVPILLRIAEQCQMGIALFPRDANLELMDQYLTNGKSRSIPIFVFIDKDGNEVAKWGPRADKIQHFLNDARANLPDERADDYKEKWNEMLLFMTKSFRDNTDFGDEVYESIKKTIAAATVS
ncbi:thioredoxin family protein [Virgibacillus phasianinus]|uniref:Thioredoxin family protein n=1 Tax=Virgibacillus phasianinus TaxID=2017483 RepID=A0A220U579_9BACI|nr:thioredoxin family protein [Virgibacillus phasianinus]ASK62883.1 thioredoxin family protein [Virgibacillus phasianinus]